MFMNRQKKVFENFYLSLQQSSIGQKKLPIKVNLYPSSDREFSKKNVSSCCG